MKRWLALGVSIFATTPVVAVAIIEVIIAKIYQVEDIHKILLADAR